MNAIIKYLFELPHPQLENESANPRSTTGYHDTMLTETSSQAFSNHKIHFYINNEVTTKLTRGI